MADCLLEVEDDLDFPVSGERRGLIQVRRDSGAALAFPSSALVRAAQAAGHPYVENHNAPFTTGVGPAPLNISVDGSRLSASSTFLQAARGRANLEVVSDVLVERVVLDGASVEGVACRSAGHPGLLLFTASCVVLAAGAFGTPAILQRSGVGPRPLLEDLGIPVVVDLPGVGANLSDHVQVPLTFLYDGIEQRQRVPCVQVLLRYTSSGPGNRRNDMQLCALNHVELEGYNPALFASWDVQRASSLTANLMVPRGRGTVRVCVEDGRTTTVIDHGFVADRADLARLCEGVRKACAMLVEKPFVDRILRLHRPTDGELGDDAALGRWIAENFQPGHHPVGTARMGDDGDPDAVVTGNLAVRGTNGLHVADASILPNPVRANTNMTVMALARNALRLLRTGDTRPERKQ